MYKTSTIVVVWIRMFWLWCGWVLLFIIKVFTLLAYETLYNLWWNTLYDAWKDGIDMDEVKWSEKEVLMPIKIVSLWHKSRNKVEIWFKKWYIISELLFEQHEHSQLLMMFWISQIKTNTIWMKMVTLPVKSQFTVWEF